MKRSEFLKKTALGATGLIASGGVAASSKNNTNRPGDTHSDQVGFNHIPNKEERTMNTMLYKANTRGHADHGWLDTWHTFSFANYYNPERMNFGVLRVLNDDTVAPGRGFGTHPHDNMEIVSIPLSGDLEHKDSMGNVAVIKQGDVQVMSAGTGIYHSEYNKNSDKEVKFLQIWLFPEKKNVEPRYDQISLKDIRKDNDFYQVLSPNPVDEGVWIHQQAWFHIGEFDKKLEKKYVFRKPGNGLFVFVIEGSVKAGDQTLERRDGLAIWNVNEVSFDIQGPSKVLLMEIPV